jgi:hypothetical protein
VAFNEYGTNLFKSKHDPLTVIEAKVAMTKEKDKLFRDINTTDKGKDKLGTIVEEEELAREEPENIQAEFPSPNGSSQEALGFDHSPQEETQPVKPRIFIEKSESVYHRDSPWISGYRVQNVSQMNTQSHTFHHIKVRVHKFITCPLWSTSIQASWLNQSEKFYAMVAIFSEGSPSFILPATGNLERSDASLSRTICRRCSRTRSRTLHTQSLSPRSGIGPRHQLYAALSGLTSKGRKRDKEAALVSCAAAVEYKQGISKNIPRSQVSQHSSEAPGHPGDPSPQPTPV